jgi:DMSO/TMAO reductase YedYZ molybdopterin-dependent catalytic subunit
VRLADLLAEAGVKPEAAFIHVAGADRMASPLTPAYER